MKEEKPTYTYQDSKMKIMFAVIISLCFIASVPVHSYSYYNNGIISNSNNMKNKMSNNKLNIRSTSPSPSPSHLTSTLTATETQQQPLPDTMNLAQIRASIPTAAFEKSLPRSLSHMFIDYSILGGAFFAFLTLTKSALWSNMSPLLKAVSTFGYSQVAGFMMWCIFVVGHDCGHGTFSDNKKINKIIGHITHGSILVPFFAWQLSHRRHHMNHNHVKNDYSYKWFTPDQEPSFAAKVFTQNKFIATILPFFGWPVYLFGIDDGSHFVPFRNHRLWKNSPRVETVKCAISTAVVAAFATLYYKLAGSSLKTLALYFAGPYTMFSWWLVTVTYLQHHGPSTLVYGDKDWSFVRAGFETVDRTFGKVIDKMHHHITSDHVIHHMFYTAIPHYNLPLATAALKEHLKTNGQEHLYKFDDTRDFPIRVHKYLWTNGFKAKYADVDANVNTNVNTDQDSEMALA